MEKERRIKVFSLCALIVAVLGLTIAFAALSQTLTIKGSADVSAASWDIHFKNNMEAATAGSAKILKQPTLDNDSLSIKDFEVSLTKPGDIATLMVDIVNDGTITAKYQRGIEAGGKINYDISDDFTADDFYDAVFEEADLDGDGITTKEEKRKTAEFIYPVFNETGYSVTPSGDGEEVLYPGGVMHVLVAFKFDANATELPKGNVKLKIDWIRYIFSQL